MSGIESTLITSLENYIISFIGGSNMSSALKTNLAGVVVMIMEWVENSLTGLLSSLGEVTSEMKHSSVLSYLETLYQKYIGTPLAPETKSVASGFVGVVCSASKGGVAINGVSPPKPSSAVSVPAPTVTVTPTPAPKKKASRSASFLGLRKTTK
jgi:hypothetical protein